MPDVKGALRPGAVTLHRAVWSPLLLLALSAAPVPAVETLSAALVEVSGPRARGPGVVVGADGQVLTSVRFVGLDEASVVTGGESHGGEVLAADARLGVAVVKAGGGPWVAAATRQREDCRKGERLVALTRSGEGATSTQLGTVLRMGTEARPFLQTDLRAAPGTPLFDARGRLVAVLVDGRGRALPVSMVRRLLAGGVTAP